MIFIRQQRCFGNIRFSWFYRLLFFAVLITFGSIFSSNVRADVLELRYTIQAPNDSTQIRTIAPVGDFNADGYGDLALGIRGIHPNLYSAVFLYYGGPAFDDQADLIFQGLPQDTIICSAPEDSYTSYGSSITGLGDYNGDGYDDFAVGSTNLCYNLLLNGAVYFYFGSPNPDTTVDIFIAGEENWDVFGAILVNGNFNGDLYGDLLAPTCDLFSGQKVYIFLGSDPANGQYDWRLDYSNLAMTLNNFQGGRDINDDGYEDFSWKFHDSINNISGTMLFFGDNPVDTLPYAEIVDTNFYLEDDISDDGVDDFIITAYNPPGGHFLCLGGDPFNTFPDYGIPTNLVFITPSVFTLPSGERKFVMDDIGNRRLFFYNTGVPLDTTNYEFYYYGFQHGRGPYNVGDIDGSDGEEIALADNPLELVNIYSGIQTAIEDKSQFLENPTNFDLLFCYPNPFNAATTIFYYTQQRTEKAPHIDVFNILGEFVKRQYTIKEKEGLYVTTWDATDISRGKISSGIYILKLVAGDSILSTKVTLIK